MGSVCSNKCNKVNKICKTCGKIFYIQLNRHLSGRGKFCSNNCRKGSYLKFSKNYKLNEDMSELIGVLIGDGGIWKDRIYISGNPIEDKYYMEQYLPNLVKKCVGKTPRVFMGKNGALIVQFQNKSFRLFLETLGIIKRKSKISDIPKQIFQNKKLLKRFIQGVADTDFTLIFTKCHTDVNHYPRITSAFASKDLVLSLEKSLREMGFTLNTRYNCKKEDNRGHKWEINYINLDGPHNLERWMKLIGFKNLRIISRYAFWKKNGYLMSKSTLPERLKNLEWKGGDFYNENFSF